MTRLRFKIKTQNWALFFAVFSIFFGCQIQEDEKYNLGFEKINQNTGLAEGWFRAADSRVSISKDALSGEYAGVISSNNVDEYGRLAYIIPAVYDGDTIRLEANVRLEKSNKGNAGLFISAKGTIANDSDLSLSFRSTEPEQVQISKWQKLEISCPLPEKSDYIVIGGFLTGKGRAIFDDFKVSIDGRDIHTLKSNGRIINKADLDKEFDSGSRIYIEELSEFNIKSLYTLCKVWGFLKYYHPKIAKGEINWDFELLRLMPRFLKANNKKQLNSIVLKWIKQYGQSHSKTDRLFESTSKVTTQKPRLDWIMENDFSPEISKILTDIYINRHQGDHYYLKLNPNVGNPLFTHENSYYLVPWSDDGYRVLALFRYWNAIEYFFPYKYLMEEDWDDVLQEYILKMIDVDSKIDYEQTMSGLITEIQDTHAVLFGKVDDNRFISPLEIEFVENKFIVSSYKDRDLGLKSGLKIGDIITKVDGKSIEIIVDSLAQLIGASNKISLMRDIANELLTSKEEVIDVEVNSFSQTKKKQLILFPSESFNESEIKLPRASYKFIEDDIGYVDLGKIREEEIDLIKNEFLGAKGVIIDIRNYPNSFVPFTLGSFFVSRPTPFVKFSRVNSQNFGEFNFTEPLKIYPDTIIFKNQLIVLINERSQSQSEYTTMAFQAGVNTMTIGSTTAGTDGNVSYLNLPSGYSTRFSGIGIYYPDGKETQRVGIVPDIFVKPTLNGIVNGEDEVLNKAIEVINGY